MTVHSALTDPEIHEPKGASTALSGQTYVSNGAGSGSFDYPALQGQSGASINEVPISDGAGGVGFALPFITRPGWKDMIMPFYSASAGPALSTPGWVKVRDDGAGSTGVYQRGFDDTVEEELFATFHVDHDYKVGTAWYPHVHWMPLSTGVGVVRWGIEWTYAVRDDVTPAVFGVTQFTYLEQAGCGTANTHQVIEVADPGITLANCEPDTLIMCRIFRDATHVNDTYVGDAIGLFLDAHYQIDRNATLNKAPDFYA